MTYSFFFFFFFFFFIIIINIMITLILFIIIILIISEARLDLPASVGLDTLKQQKESDIDRSTYQRQSRIA